MADGSQTTPPKGLIRGRLIGLLGNGVRRGKSAVAQEPHYSLVYAPTLLGPYTENDLNPTKSIGNSAGTNHIYGLHAMRSRDIY